MPSTKMKEYIMHKLFELPSYTPIRVFQRRSTSASVGDTPSSEWFDHILDEAHPLPEGLVMVSPVMTHAAFQSPTPPSPPGTPTRPTRSFSLDTHLSKGTRWAVVNGLQQRIRARLTWTRRRSADDASLHTDTDSDDDTGVIVPSVIIETVHGEKHQKSSTSSSSTLEFYDTTTSISSPPLDAISEEDDGKKHITFSMAPMVRHMYFAVESYEEWVIRVSNGYATCDLRPAHVKLHAFCTKSLTYLKYRESPCVEVFALGAHDISMWRTLGHHNWTRDAVPAPHEETMQQHDNNVDSDEYTKDGLASPTSPLTDDEGENDPHSCSDRDDDDEDIQVELERVPFVPQNADLQPLLDVINATVGKGDTLFTLADMMHFCCELEYPKRDGRDEDGWC